MTHRSQSLTTAQGTLRYSVAHRPRVTRRMHLELDERGELVVVVPRDWPDFYTRRLLRKHLPYVRRFLERASTRRLTPLQYTNGATHLFRGSPLLLSLRPGVRGREAKIEGNRLHLPVPTSEPATVRRALQRWYTEQARTLFSERLAALRTRAPWARERQLRLALRRMRRTWGTCSHNGVIRLNTHLVKAPPDCLDYVVAHELCHLQVMNHGPEFYALQERLWPEWRSTRARLREHGHRYTQE